MLGSNNPWLSTVAIFAVSCSFGGIAVGVEDVVVNTEVWNWVVLVPWVSIFLELSMSSCLGFAFDGVASWDGGFLSSNNPLLSAVSIGAVSFGVFVMGPGVENVMVHSEVWNEVVYVVR